MKPNLFTARLTLAALVVTLCGVPEMVQAQSAQPATAPAQQEAPATTQRPDAPASGAAQATSPDTAQRTPGDQPSSDTQTSPAQQNSAQQQPAPAQQNNGIVDPSKGPLTPVPSDNQELPNAPSSAQTPAPNQASPQTAPAQQPAGAAAAQTAPTAGGVASKPAGNAIAPAKQRQVRSLLIKLGAIAAAGAAIGTVVALSKGSPSTPPGAR